MRTGEDDVRIAQGDQAGARNNCLFSAGMTRSLWAENAKWLPGRRTRRISTG